MENESNLEDTLASSWFRSFLKLVGLKIWRHHYTPVPIVLIVNIFVFDSLLRCSGLNFESILTQTVGDIEDRLKMESKETASGPVSSRHALTTRV